MWLNAFRLFMQCLLSLHWMLNFSQYISRLEIFTSVLFLMPALSILNLKLAPFELQIGSLTTSKIKCGKIAAVTLYCHQNWLAHRSRSNPLIASPFSELLLGIYSYLQGWIFAGHPFDTPLCQTWNAFQVSAASIIPPTHNKAGTAAEEVSDDTSYKLSI